MKLSDLKAGDKVKVDAGFPCMLEGEKEVFADGRGELYVVCRAGHHYLKAQEDADSKELNLLGVSAI